MKISYLPGKYSQQRQRERAANIYPVHLAMEATYYAQKGHEVHWGRAVGKYDKVVYAPEGILFLALPKPDRKLTDCHNAYYQRNGNFKKRPGTYIQSAVGCWHGKCTFCVEKEKRWEVRPLGSVLQEIDECHDLGFREIFDDSATFPVGDWLGGFCKWARKDLTYGCNMRMVDVDYAMMKKAGFRMLLFGLESANQDTLDRIQKGTSVRDVKYIIHAANCGLEPHIAVMFGCPGETDKDSINTLKLVHSLLRKGYAKTAQASFYNAVGVRSESQRKYVRRIYEAAYYPDFWFNQLKDIKNMDDIKYLWLKIKKGIGFCE